MNSIAKNSAASIAAVALGLVVAFAFVASPAQAASCAYTFSSSLKMGSTGTAVKELQMFLNMSADTQVSATGPGSPGAESMNFGPATKAAVIKFQNKYKADVLTPNGLTVGTGFFGASSRAKGVALCGGVMTGPVTPVPGTGLTVSAAAQPANSLAPRGASRIPFTKFTLTAGTDGAVTVNSITVKRTGLSANADFQGVVLLDDMGNQLGTEKTFNSLYMATIGQTVTIPAGTSKTFTVAGNISTTNGPGNVALIEVTGINTTATVTGSLPISGAAHTMNASLTIGSITFSTSNAFSTNATTTKEIGTVAYPFAGYRITAGSVEDVRITNLRWNQTGSVGSSDLANVMTYVNGTAYPTVVSADGKYYDANLGTGILVAKGNQVEVYIKADVVGSNVNNRTVIFNVDKNTDIVARGEQFGYSMSPAVAGSPFFFGSQVTLQGASITSINKENSVAAQNIAVNVPNQPLGGFYSDIVGEGITIQTMKFTVASSSGSGTGLLTNVSLVDGNGTVVAGPVDGVYVSPTVQSLTFSDSVTFKAGKTIYTLRGKVASTIGNGTQYVVSSTVSSSNFTNPKGEITGNTISLPGTALTLNTMTVKAAALAASISTSPAAQNLVAGAQDVTFATFQFDASNSGEDVRLSSVGASFGTPANLSSCRLYDGATNLTTGSNSINAPGATGTFLLSNPLTIAKGTVKSLNAVCNVIPGAAGNSNVGLQLPSSSSGVSATGVNSGNPISVTGSAAAGQTMTFAAGSVAVSLDSSSPSLSLASSNAQGVTLGVIKLRASNEAVNLVKIGLTLGAATTTKNMAAVTLWSNNIQVGTGLFTGTTQAVTLISPLLLPKDTDVLLTIKGNVPMIGSSQVALQGSLVTIGWDSTAGNNQFTGVGSGSDLTPTGSASAAGIRIFKSVPTVARIALPSTNNLSNGTFDIFRFSVAANSAGNISLKKVTANVTNAVPTLSNAKVVAYTDSGFNTTVGGVFTNGELVTGVAITSNSDNDFVFTSPIVIPAGATYYFRIIADVAGVVATGNSISTKLTGDTAPAYTGVTTYATAAADGQNDFIWAGNTYGDSPVTDADWFNGNQVIGLPASDTDSSTNTRP